MPFSNMDVEKNASATTMSVMDSSFLVRIWESEPINLLPTSKYKKCENRYFSVLYSF